MYTNKEVMEITKKQLAIDYNCKVGDFSRATNIFTKNILNKGRRMYRHDECFIKILSFCGIVVFKADEKIIPWMKEKYDNTDGNWIFKYSNVKQIDKKLYEYGHVIADIHHYYIPKINNKEVRPLFNTIWFENEELLQFKNDKRFNEALGFNETNPDVLAVVALDGDNIMGMAGASADSDLMWQIGIDVMPQYRGWGIGSNLTSLLKQEILNRGKVPFYGTVESHNISKRIAIKAGFIPAWAEAYSQKI